jgi:hypothetical protein
MFLKIRENDGRYFVINMNQIVSIGIDVDNDNYTVINTTNNNLYYVKMHFDEVLKILNAYGRFDIVRLN